MTAPRFHNCYQDEEPGLSPKSTRLVFKAAIFHGSGHDELQRIRIGSDDEGKWDVLWLSADWGEGTVPLAWVAKGTLRGRALWTGLVHAWFLGASSAKTPMRLPTMSTPLRITPCWTKPPSRPSSSKSGLRRKRTKPKEPNEGPLRRGP
jgi:hypothetical protein